MRLNESKFEEMNKFGLLCMSKQCLRQFAGNTVVVATQKVTIAARNQDCLASRGTVVHALTSFASCCHPKIFGAFFVLLMHSWLSFDCGRRETIYLCGVQTIIK